MITSKGKDGRERKLLLNETVSLMDKYDSLSFDVVVPEHKENFKLVFEFDDEGEPLQSTIIQLKNPEAYRITLHKWYADTWVENIQPIPITSDDGKLRIYLKFRTSAQEDTFNFRLFYLSIWTEEII